MALAALYVAAPAYGETGESGPETLVARFIDAWNAHDPEAFAKLFAGDADWVTASGVRLRGREKIRDYLADEHARWARTTRMSFANVHVRKLGQDSATVFFEREITSEAAGPGESKSSRPGNNLFVAKRIDSRWVIVAGQVARKPPT